MKTYFIGGPWDLTVRMLPPGTGGAYRVAVPSNPAGVWSLSAKQGDLLVAETFVYYLRKVGRDVWVALPEEDL